MKRTRGRDKLLPRERIDRMIDDGSSFLELSQVLFFSSFFFFKIIIFCKIMHCPLALAL